jgi:two-component system sensor histidine kinase RstB
MTHLFLRFYLGVLVVLLVAWIIYGFVYKQQATAATQRLILQAHRGGIEVVAQKIEASDAPLDVTLKEVQSHFRYPVEWVSLEQLSEVSRRQFRTADAIAAVEEDGRWHILRRLGASQQLVRLGPFPDYELQEIEDTIGGWMRLVRDRVQTTRPSARRSILRQIEGDFALPIQTIERDALPEWPRGRLEQGKVEVVFYPRDKDQWFASIPLSENRTEGALLEFGPFPNFHPPAQQAATTTLTLVLFPVAMAIAMLLRPIAVQLRSLEKVALSVADGNLSARVDLKKTPSAKSLSLAFNSMAHRIEDLVESQRHLLQAVSHELRTPLARMRFAIDLIQNTENTDERNQKLDSLDSDAEELNSLLTELLNYTRLEGQNPNSSRDSWPVAQVVGDLLPKYQALFPDKQFEMRSDSLDSPCAINGPIHQIERAIGNVLSNAGRYATTSIQISLRESEGTIGLVVDDDGAGIRPEERERALLPFVRLNEGESTQGFGLGLALVQRILEKQSGEVRIEDSPMGGARLLLIWPKAPPG